MLVKLLGTAAVSGPDEPSGISRIIQIQSRVTVAEVMFFMPGEGTIWTYGSVTENKLKLYSILTQTIT